MADQVASALIKEGTYQQVLRNPFGTRAIHLEGRISEYKKGNLPLRIKSNFMTGHAELTIELRVTELPSEYEASQFRVSVTSRRTSADARRTGRETIENLRAEAAKTIAKRLASN